MSYIVFARKYRPQTFDDIVGQPHIITTLKNAISQNRTAHAYLFAGPRGVGKTTTARILAKAINCEKGSTVDPCNSCTSCKEITSGTGLDVLEIDGASNRGIDEIRNLRDNVKFSPSKGRFKVYIIDEVHMLTTEAFNALLKTLEEPPPHVKFIFATTQVHKVPPTILSRCQRFDFRRISAKDTFESLKKIVKSERLSVKDEALTMIAKYADGSMRDAQVVLDQIASFVQGEVGIEDVSKMLGVVDDEVLFGLSRAIAEKEPVGALKIIDRIVNEGKDIVQVVLGLIEHFRNLSIVKISDNLNSLIDADPEKIKDYEAESKRFTIEEMLYVIYTLSNTIDFIRKSSLSKIPFEAAILKLTKRDSIMRLTDIMDRINGLGAGKETMGQLRAEIPVKEVRPNMVKDEASGKPKIPEEEAVSKNTEEPQKAPARSAALDEVLSSWTGVISYIMAKKISIASYLQEGYPVNLEANTLTIGFPKEFQFHKEVLETPDNRLLIEEAISKVLSVDLRVALILVEPANVQNRNKTGYFEKDISEDLSNKGESVKKDIDPIVQSALEMFGGNISNEKSRKERLR